MSKLFQKLLQKSMAALVGLALSQLVFAADLQIPDLGETSAGLISPTQEYDLGQKWLQVYRSQMLTTSDPFIQLYVEQLVKGVAAYSEVKDRRLDILVIVNPQLNAFAVPGGIIGVQTGLFRYAATEEQFASVIAHELAHLSQRHYARQLEQRQNATAPYMAAMLASIILGMTAGSDAGLAAMAAVNAGSMDAQLRFSRQMEQEADRIGMETMARSGLDPYAMSDMFENMLKATRFTRRPPEFLMTHPVTESRVSDARLRAQQLGQTPPKSPIEYQLVRVRAQLLHESNSHQAVQQFEDELKGNNFSKEAANYGLAQALIKDNQADKAAPIVKKLRQQAPDNPYYLVAEADVLSGQENYDAAIKLLEPALKTHPNYHPYNTRLAEILMKAGRYKESNAILRAHVERRPKDEYLWYLLAEVEGLAGNIFEVHLARAEYFKLNGLLDKAEIQLANALKLVKPKDEVTRAKILENLKGVRERRRELKGL